MLKKHFNTVIEHKPILTTMNEMAVKQARLRRQIEDYLRKYATLDDLQKVVKTLNIKVKGE